MDGISFFHFIASFVLGDGLIYSFLSLFSFLSLLLCPRCCGMSDGLCFTLIYGVVGAYECVRVCVTGMFGYIYLV
jgi:hypothetical protein